MKKQKINLNLRPLTLAMALSGINFSALAASDRQRLGPDATISFEQRDSKLSNDAKEKLAEIVKEAKAKGKIAEVQVAVWSDNPMPIEGKDLSKADRDLADQRKQAVSTYLKKNLGVSDIDTFNMAESANWLAKTLRTDDAKLKSDIYGNRDQAKSSEAYKVFKEHGEPSKAVVLIILKE